MKKVYFIGFHKTGSTSLQWFLSWNQWKLAKAGILFPPGIPRGLAGFASRALEDDTSQPDRPDIQDYMGHNALAYRLLSEELPGFRFPQVLEPTPPSAMLFEIIHALAKGVSAGALILCSEDLARLSLRAPQALDKIRNQFGEDDVRLMCTVRRPDEAIAAWQGQALKGGNYIERLQDSGVEQYLDSVHLNYQHAIAPWIAMFPKADLVLSTYGSVLEAGGSVEHFKTECGLDLPQDLSPSENRNVSLHPGLFEVVRQATKAIGRRNTYLLRDWLERKVSLFQLPNKSEVEMLGPANRERLFGAFQTTHDYLSHLAAKPGFFPDIEQMLETKPISNIEATNMALPSVVEAARMSGLSPETKTFLENLNKSGV